MITKERLQELIEQRATVYVSIGKKNKIKAIELRRCDVEDDGIMLKSVCLEKTFFYKLRDICETREQAEWHKEFGNITRTERLELPTWEELQNKTEHYISFSTKKWTKCWLAIDMPYRNDFGKILITYADSDKNYHIVYDKRLTKENYTLACRKCKELFLGEKESEDE